ncbi:hypothetical protein OA253_02200 [Alphaproteobacteria bacterium]|nr:hypothetical protein [Alphaproteobacteria bacterium]
MIDGIFNGPFKNNDYVISRFLFFICNNISTNIIFDCILPSKWRYTQDLFSKKKYIDDERKLNFEKLTILSSLNIKNKMALFGFNEKDYDFVITTTLSGTSNLKNHEKYFVLEKSEVSDYPFLPQIKLYKINEPIFFGEKHEKLKKNEDINKYYYKCSNHINEYLNKLQYEVLSKIPFSKTNFKLLPVPLINHPNFLQKFGTLFKNDLNLLLKKNNNIILTHHRQSGFSKMDNLDEFFDDRIIKKIDDFLINTKTTTSLSFWYHLNNIDSFDHLKIYINNQEAKFEHTGIRSDLIENFTYLKVGSGIFNVNHENFIFENPNIKLVVEFKNKIIYEKKINTKSNNKILKQIVFKNDDFIFLENLFFRNDITKTTLLNTISEIIYITGSKACIFGYFNGLNNRAFSKNITTDFQSYYLNSFFKNNFSTNIKNYYNGIKLENYLQTDKRNKNFVDLEMF